MDGKSLFSSWSGGKDACLALFRAMQQGAQPKFLFTMLEEDGVHSRAHHLPLQVLEAQAKAVGIPLLTRAATWETYEENFIDGVTTMKQQGVELGVFGDIDLAGHREWVEKVCATTNIAASLPLWNEKRRDIIHEFVDLGFVAKIITVNEAALPKSFLGRTFDAELIAEIEALGVDACGEGGEFHTLVIDGPIFSKPVTLQYGEQYYRDGNWFQSLNL